MSDADYLSGPDRFASLYLNARQKDLKIEFTREVERVYEREHLHKPQITDKARYLTTASETGPAATTERLFQESETRQIHRAVLGKELQRVQCPFTPELTARPPPPPRRAAGEPAAPAAQSSKVHERLFPSYEDLSEKKAKGERLRMQYETEGCTFTPKINPAKPQPFVDVGAASNWDHAPVHERLNRYYAAKEMRLEMLRAQRQEEERKAAAFKPLIRPRCRSASPRIRYQRHKQSDRGIADGGNQRAVASIAEPLDLSTSVFDRLNKSSTLSQTARSEPHIAEEVADVECTFKPKIGRPPAPDRLRRHKRGRAEMGKMGLIEKRVAAGVPSPAIMKDVAGVIKRWESDESKAPTPAGKFEQAELGDQSGLSIEEVRLNNDDTQSEGQALRPSKDRSRSTMLYEIGLAQREAARQQRERAKAQQEMEGCTFVPEISRPPVKPSTEPLVDRLYAQAEIQRATMERLRMEQERQWSKHCTFKPTIPLRRRSQPGSPAPTSSQASFPRPADSVVSAVSSCPPQQLFYLDPQTGNIHRVFASDCFIANSSLQTSAPHTAKAFPLDIHGRPITQRGASTLSPQRRMADSAGSPADRTVGSSLCTGRSPRRSAGIRSTAFMSHDFMSPLRSDTLASSVGVGQLRFGPRRTALSPPRQFSTSPEAARVPDEVHERRVSCTHRTDESNRDGTTRYPYAFPLTPSLDLSSPRMMMSDTAACRKVKHRARKLSATPPPPLGPPPCLRSTSPLRRAPDHTGSDPTGIIHQQRCPYAVINDPGPALCPQRGQTQHMATFDPAKSHINLAALNKARRQLLLSQTPNQICSPVRAPAAKRPFRSPSRSRGFRPRAGSSRNSTAALTATTRCAVLNKDTERKGRQRSTNFPDGHTRSSLSPSETSDMSRAALPIQLQEGPQSASMIPESMTAEEEAMSQSYKHQKATISLPSQVQTTYRQNTIGNQQYADAGVHNIHIKRASLRQQSENIWPGSGGRLRRFEEWQADVQEKIDSLCS